MDFNGPKLVRDKIVEKIEGKLEKCSFRYATEVEFNIFLAKKFTEELLELNDAINDGDINEIMNEICDLREVIKTVERRRNLGQIINIDNGEWNDGLNTITSIMKEEYISDLIIEYKRKEKKKLNGGFEKGIILTDW